MILSRRSFLHCSLMAGGLVVVPRFGRWFKRVREPETSDAWVGEMRTLYNPYAEATWMSSVQWRYLGSSGSGKIRVEYSVDGRHWIPATLGTFKVVP